ncbi:MAG: hypothetical protein L0Y58_02310 [Verrucomicrobia subdivision 3 bacterium]|nr:hypothetical protein [Limisphaerales bacterium]
MKPTAIATFAVKRGKKEGDPIKVHFNPVSLQYTVTNTMKDEGSGNKRKQVVGQSTGKLTMDLIFDTTDSGKDVRQSTLQIAAFMTPLADRSVPIVVFRWGTLKFQGMAESYKETLDFFSGDGVPLRASINLTLAQQDAVFEANDKATGAKYDHRPRPDFDAVEVPPSPVLSPTSLATQGGDERAARSIAAANNLESMRFGAGTALTIEASVKLGPPAAFASGSLSLDAGVGIDAGAGIGISGGAGAGVSVGGSASTGVSASQGAFSGLRAAAESKGTVNLDPARLLPRGHSVNVATDSGARFNLGGQASIEGSASLGTDVGAGSSLRTRLNFDEGE